MPRKPFVGGNWKCNGTVETIQQLAESMNQDVQFDAAQVDVVLAPISLHTALAKDTLDTRFAVASQNVSATNTGAFTGEVAASQIKDFGLNWTLVGHSERRAMFGDTDEIVGTKVAIAQEHGLNVVACVGETLQQRETGETAAVLKRQLAAIIPKVADWNKVVIAYEPVWAIGTGRVATPAQAAEAHEVIRDFVAQQVSTQIADSVRIVYGGSVKPANCVELFAQEQIDGFLVGGASLKAASFAPIVQSAL
ncbi:MAG: hypothetical protein MHM6MM_000667 [Cercozoa sp. M6MM]